MALLIIVTLIWGFSFGLIKGNLTGIDPYFVAFVRMALSLLVFLPFLRIRRLPGGAFGKLLVTGVIQFGIMYIAYFLAFQTLQAYEVALFTILTPIYVILIDDAFQRKFHYQFLLTAAIAVVGTAVISYSGITSGALLTGFLLVQVSNIAFAFGQVYYRRVMRPLDDYRDQEVFGVLYLGAFLITGLSCLALTNWSTVQLGFTQYWTLIYLGVIASGLSFFLWNKGARQVDAGTLAIFNDLKVPVAVLISVVFFGESVNLINLAVGGAIVLLALVINERLVKKYQQAALEPSPSPAE
jgi:carboxylate/amino acid/amine transporter